MLCHTALIAMTMTKMHFSVLYEMPKVHRYGIPLMCYEYLCGFYSLAIMYIFNYCYVKSKGFDVGCKSMRCKQHRKIWDFNKYKKNACGFKTFSWKSKNYASFLLIPLYCTLSYPPLPYHFILPLLSFFIIPYLILYHLIISSFILPYLILSHLTLPYFTTSYLIISYLILPYHNLFYITFSLYGGSQVKMLVTTSSWPVCWIRAQSKIEAASIQCQRCQQSSPIQQMTADNHTQWNRHHIIFIYVVSDSLFQSRCSTYYHSSSANRHLQLAPDMITSLKFSHPK